MKRGFVAGILERRVLSIGKVAREGGEGGDW